MAEVRRFGLRHGVVININHVIQHANGGTHCAAQLVEVQLAILNMLGQVDRAQVAHGNLFRVGIERDFRTQVG